MNAPFDPVDFVHRLEQEGIARGAAETIARGIEDRNRELATKADLERGLGELERCLVALRQATKDDLDRSVNDLKSATKADRDTALARQTIQFGAMLTVPMGLLIALASVAVALK